MHPDPSGLAHSQSPVDLPEPATPLDHPLRWTTTVLAVATLSLALLNAHAIRGWAYQLPEGAASERAVSVAEAWHGLADRAGLNAPGAAMRGQWQGARARRFEAQSSASEGAASRSARANSSSARG